MSNMQQSTQSNLMEIPPDMTPNAQVLSQGKTNLLSAATASSSGNANAQPESLPGPVYNKNLDFTVGITPNRRTVTLHYVEVPAAVGLYCETLKFTRGVPSNGKLEYSFNPDGNEHMVKVVNQNSVVGAFHLKPSPTKLSKVPSEPKKFLIENLYNKESLKLFANKRMIWSLTPHQELENAYILDFDPCDQSVNAEIKTLNSNGEYSLIFNGKLFISKGDDNTPVEQSTEVATNQHIARQSLYPPPDSKSGLKSVQ